MLDQWVEETASAMLARWLLEHREREAAAPEQSAAKPEERTSASDNFFSNSTFAGG